ncbi:MAG: hypothetical protein NTY38_20295, partial [Acidobacteria bacterium]|nr:hypothetical protein [Acidobacteriota bacterium]
YDAVGNQLKKTDREGRSTTSVYDGVNRRTSTTDALGNVTQFQYDGVGNLLKLTDARGNATTFTYDNVNRVIRQQSPGPLPNLRTYSYDGAGNPLTRVDELGRTTTYSYNDLYFLTKRSYPASAADNFTYDLSGRALSAGKAGWVTTFAYDGANRVVQTTQNGKAVGYQFNVAGRTRKVTYPGGRVITEGYDFRNYLLQSNDGAAPPIVNYTYDAASRMVSRGYRNGVVATSTYNANNWLLSFDHKLGGTRIVGFAYDRDREGNSKDEKKLHAPSLSEAYAYDTTYRLIDYKVGTLVGSTVPVPATQTQYNLDQTGNWNSKTTDAVVQNRTHNAANQTTADGAAALLHEGTGNLINDGTMLYVHDEENRLTMVKRKSDGFVLGQYQYDALGRRVRRVDAFGTETRYFYDDWRAIEEQSPSGATLATYVFGASADEAVTMERGRIQVAYSLRRTGMMLTVIRSAICQAGMERSISVATT